MKRRIKKEGEALTKTYLGEETPRVGEFIHQKPSENETEIRGEVTKVIRVIDYLGGLEETVVITIR
jgi:hypothetical protein